MKIDWYKEHRLEEARFILSIIENQQIFPFDSEWIHTQIKKRVNDLEKDVDGWRVVNE